MAPLNEKEMPATVLNEQIRKLLYTWPEMAMVLVYKNFYHNLIRIADMHTRDSDASKDVLQEVFVDIWQKREQLGQQRDESIQHYLIKAVRYHAITLYKKNTKTATCETEYFYRHGDETAEKSVENRIVAADKETFIRLVIATFPPREKQCLLMQVDDELTVREIAKRLGITKKAVERSLTSARKRLRKFREPLL